ncbi:MAG: CPBP family intramembrane glutamic endopeptidase [Myxococcota bacterium]
MGARQPTTPREAPARAPTVVGFYAALLLGGFFWHAVSQDSNDIWRLDPTQGWVALLLTPLWGVGFGLVTVQVFRALETRMRWLSELHREFSGIFGRPRPRELVLLAAASALGEEILFRGAMLDAWGLWISSAVFALLHIPRSATLWPWTLSSFVLGLALAAITLATGNLGAAVAAHFVINLLNMAYITRHRPRVHVGAVQPPR